MPRKGQNTSVDKRQLVIYRKGKDKSYREIAKKSIVEIEELSIINDEEEHSCEYY